MISERKSITSQIFFFFFFFPIDESYYLSTNKPCNLQLGLHLQCQLYLSSIVKYGFVRDIPGRSENAVPMVYRHARRRSLLKVAVCQPLGLRDIILARATAAAAAAAAALETFSSTSCCGCVAKATGSIGEEVRHQLRVPKKRAPSQTLERQFLNKRFEVVAGYRLQ